MAFDNPLWWKRSRWHEAGIAPQIEAEEGRRIQNFGTRRGPRTAAKAAQKARGKDRRFAGPETPEEEGYALFKMLLARGYYDELRRQFEQADE